MGNILVKEREIVIPGEELAEGMDFLPGENTYRDGEKVYSKSLGLISIAGRVVKITPLSGPYVPKVGDKIIAKAIDITMNGWRFDTNTAYSAMLQISEATSRFIKKDEDLSRIIAIGDYAVTKIIRVTSQNLIDLSMREPGLFKVQGGRIININSQKVPRVIGKQGSMITLIKNKTGCVITVGQNGLIWIKGSPEGELLAEKAIKLIEEKSHLEGLTEQVDQFLDKNKPAGLVLTPPPEEQQESGEQLEFSGPKDEQGYQPRINKERTYTAPKTETKDTNLEEGFDDVF